MFTPTAEQNHILDNLEMDAPMKIDALAGSGKTASLSLISNNIDTPSLLLVFNKSAQQDAQKRFPSHVEVRTTHSMAYQAVGFDYQHKLRRPVGKYVNVAGTAAEVAKYYNIKPFKAGERVIKSSYIGYLVLGVVSRFESSNADKISDKFISKAALEDLKEKHEGFDDKAFSKVVVKAAKQLWEDRLDIDSDVLITHDTYMKIYQLSKPTLHYDIIYLDEAQDTTDCVLDIVLRQKAKLIIVGDENQAIYGWRGAVNAMKKVEGNVFPLTKSFRFGQQVADVATKVLEKKKIVRACETMESVVGEDVVDKDKPFTILYRTNMCLITDVVRFIETERDVSINIEIDVRDFSKLLSSADALRRGNFGRVKHDLLLAYHDWSELKDDAENDPVLMRLVKIIEQNRSARILKVLENHQNSRKPHIIFTTAHKSKGREWDQVVLAEDFPSHLDDKGEWKGLSQEEQNLLYVAVTRAKKALNINKSVQEVVAQDLMEKVDKDNS